LLEGTKLPVINHRRRLRAASVRFYETGVVNRRLIGYLEAGDTLDEFLDNFPSVTRAAAMSALEEAKTLLIRAR